MSLRLSLFELEVRKGMKPKNFENLISYIRHGSLSRLILVLYLYIWHCVHQKHADTMVKKWSGNCNHRTITFLCFFSSSFKKEDLFPIDKKLSIEPNTTLSYLNTMLSAIGFLSDKLKEHGILSNDSTTLLYMLNVENHYSEESGLKSSIIKSYKHINIKRNTQIRKERHWNQVWDE